MNQNIHHSISQNVQKYRLLNNMTQKELICEIFHIGIENLIEVNTSADTASDELTEKLTSQIKSLSSSQLIIVEKFISDFVPYIK